MKSAQSRDDAYATGRQFARALGCEGAADPAAALRAKDAADLFSFPPAYRDMLGWTVPYVPVVDGYVLTEAPGTIFAEGRQPAVPLIVGSNASEGNLFTAGVNPPPASAKSTKPKLLPSVTLSAEGYRAAIALMYGEFAPEVLAMFPAATDEAVAPALSSLFTLMSFTSAARFAADAMVAKTPNVYVYRFSRFPPLFKLGACHGIEVPYVFGTLVDKAALDEGGLAGLKLHWLMLEQAALDLAVGTFDRRDHNASKALLGYWTNFAKTGDPNGPGLADWQAFDTQTAPYLEVADTIATLNGLDDAGCALAERIWSAGLPVAAPAVPAVTGG
jgi:para-nitrobenzyl esterase